MKSELAQALEYWNKLTFDKKHELAVKYDNVTKIEIWKKETQEYNETFNPDAHSHLIIDFDKVETIEEDPCITFAENYVKKYNGVGRDVLHIVVGIKSDAARNYWFKIFQEEQKTIKQLFEELDPLKRAELIQGYCDECGQNTTCYCKNDE